VKPESPDAPPAPRPWWRRLPAAILAAHRPPPPGATLAGYRLLRCLGGSRARTFEALSPDGDRVALKVLDLPPADGQRDALAQEAAARFEQECAGLRRLTHPRIVRLLDAGQQGRQAWLAMQWLPGGDLSAHTRAPLLLPVSQVRRIGQELAQALAHAHAQGVLHRDLKPANVLLDAQGHAWLADFGVAQWAGLGATRTGLALGSPAYAAPEQLSGAAVGPAADLYSLGVLMFELLAGRLPFESHSLGQLLQQVAHSEPPSLAALRPDVPPDLAALVTRLLAKRASDRPASAQALAEDPAFTRSGDLVVAAGTSCEARQNR
jgi:serine/threonine-protein kinase